MNTWIAGVVALVLAVPAASNARPPVSSTEQPAAKDPGRFALRTELLLTPPDGYRIRYVQPSPDRRRVAVSLVPVKPKGHIRLKSGGEEMKLPFKGQYWIEGVGMHQWDAVTSFTWSPDGRRYAYVGVDLDAPEDRQWVVVVDGTKVGNYQGLATPEILFSPDGLHYAFWIAEAQGKTITSNRVVVDGVASEPFDVLAFTGEGAWLTFAPRGGRWVAFCRKGGWRHAIVDGRLGPQFDETAYAPVFSADGERLAYVGVRYVGSRDKQWFLVEGDSLHGPFDDVASPVFSPVSNDLAYCVREGERSYVALNHRPLRRYRRVLEPAFAPDGRLAYLAQEVDSSFVVVDSTEGVRFISAATPRVSQGQLYYYVRLDSTGTRRAWCLEGRLLPEMSGTFENVSDDGGKRFPWGLWLSAAPAGGRVAYGWRVSQNEFHVAVGDRVWDDLVSADPAVWSADGRRCAFRVLLPHDREAVVVDGERGPVYKRVWEPAFSPDGEAVAYVASPKNDEAMLVINGRTSPTYEAIIPGKASFESDGTLVCYAAKRAEVYRLVFAVAGR